MVDFTKPIRLVANREARYIGRGSHALFPHIVEALSVGNNWYVMMVNDNGRPNDNSSRIINVPAPENVPEEW